MKLAKIDITWFRCFKLLEVKLHPDINVIVGANGAGKSSLLDAIAIALYELVAANGGGGKSQRKMQGAALLPTDIYIDSSEKEDLSGRKSFVQVRAMASDYYHIDDNSLKPLLDEESVLEWTEHIAKLLGADHQFEQIPADVGTYGAENSRVLAEVFGADSRPGNIKTVDKLRDYLQMIEKQLHDTPEAKAFRRELESALGTSDADLRRADLRIKQIRILGQR